MGQSPIPEAAITSWEKQNNFFAVTSSSINRRLTPQTVPPLKSTDTVNARMDKMIKDYTVFVVSKSHCPFCKTAKNVLAQYDIPPEKMKIMDIEGDKDASQIQNYMRQVTGGRTVPRVFINGEC